MAKPNKNKYYNQLGEITGNLKDIMGMGAGSARADTNYLTNLGKVSKLKGTEMDNRATESIWQSLQHLLPGMTPGEAYTANLGLHGKGYNRALTVTEQMMRDPKVKRALEEANLAEQNTLSATRLGSVEQALLDNRPNDRQTPPLNPMQELQHEFEKGKGKERFANDMRTLLALQGNQPNRNLDPTGARGAADDILRELESKATVKKTESYADWNQERKEYVKKLGDKNVSLIEERINSLKGITDARKNAILNDVLNRIAELDQKILTEKGKRLTQEKRRELIAAQMDVEIEKELTQEEKTENEWLRGVDIEKATELKEKQIETEGVKKEKVEKERDIVGLKLDKMPERLKEELAILVKRKEKLDADILKLQKQGDSAVALTALRSAQRHKVNVEKSIARALEPYRKDLLEAQAGSAMKGTYETLMYPNKHLKSTSEDFGDGTIPTDGGDEPDPELNAPPPDGSTFGTHNMGPNWEKFKRWITGSQPTGGVAAGQGQKPNPIEVEFSKLSKQPVHTWSSQQRAKYIDHAVNSLGLDPTAAKALLQRAIQSQGPTIRR